MGARLSRSRPPDSDDRLRPCLDEIGFVGKSPGRYTFCLGTNYTRERLNKTYRKMLNEKLLFRILRRRRQPTPTTANRRNGSATS